MDLPFTGIYKPLGEFVLEFHQLLQYSLLCIPCTIYVDIF
jgi:hypothetical protein